MDDISKIVDSLRTTITLSKFLIVKDKDDVILDVLRKSALETDKQFPDNEIYQSESKMILEYLNWVEWMKGGDMEGEDENE